MSLRAAMHVPERVSSFSRKIGSESDGGRDEKRRPATNAGLSQLLERKKDSFLYRAARPGLSDGYSHARRSSSRGDVLCRRYDLQRLQRQRGRDCGRKGTLRHHQGKLERWMKQDGL